MNQNKKENPFFTLAESTVGADTVEANENSMSQYPEIYY